MSRVTFILLCVFLLPQFSAHAETTPPNPEAEFRTKLGGIFDSLQKSDKAQIPPDQKRRILLATKGVVGEAKDKDALLAGLKPVEVAEKLPEGALSIPIAALVVNKDIKVKDVEEKGHEASRKTLDEGTFNDDAIKDFKSKFTPASDSVEKELDAAQKRAEADQKAREEAKNNLDKAQKEADQRNAEGQKKQVDDANKRVEEVKKQAEEALAKQKEQAEKALEEQRKRAEQALAKNSGGQGGGAAGGAGSGGGSGSGGAGGSSSGGSASGGKEQKGLEFKPLQLPEGPKESGGDLFAGLNEMLTNRKPSSDSPVPSFNPVTVSNKNLNVDPRPNNVLADAPMKQAGGIKIGDATGLSANLGFADNAKNGGAQANNANSGGGDPAVKGNVNPTPSNTGTDAYPNTGKQSYTPTTPISPMITAGESPGGGSAESVAKEGEGAPEGDDEKGSRYSFKSQVVPPLTGASHEDLHLGIMAYVHHLPDTMCGAAVTKKAEVCSRKKSTDKQQASRGKIVDPSRIVSAVTGLPE